MSLSEHAADGPGEMGKTGVRFPPSTDQKDIAQDIPLVSEAPRVYCPCDGKPSESVSETRVQIVFETES